MSGDDLADDFVPDEEVAIEDNDEEVPDDALFSADEGDNSPSNQSSSVAADPQPSDAALNKKRKRKEKDKQRKRKRAEAAVLNAADSNNPLSTPDSLSSQSPEHLQTYLATIQAKTHPQMSGIELMDIRIPATAIADTTVWTGPRTLDQLPSFIIKTLPTLRTRLSQRSKTNGAPTLIFLTSAALRAVDVTRVLKSSPNLRGDKGGEIAKLFAKHIKISEQVTYLKRTKIGIAAGTPGRVGKLLCDTDALSVSALSHIILDASYRDPKNRSLLDIPETRDELFKLVFECSKMREVIQKGQVQLVLF